MPTLHTAIALPWEHGSPLAAAEAAVGWSTSMKVDVAVDVPHAQSMAADAAMVSPWRLAFPLPALTATIPWGETQQVDGAKGLPWLWAGVVASHETATPWRATTPLDREHGSGWRMGTPVDAAATLLWFAALPVDRAKESAWSLAVPLDGVLALPWGALATGGVIAFCRLTWRDRATIDQTFSLLWNLLKGSTIRMPTLTLTKVSTAESIPVLAASASLDLDSWAWEVRATLATQAGADKLRPTGAGPVEVELSINGHLWRALVEEIEVERQFAAATWNISGRSPAALLDAPYAPLQTRQWESALLARQIVTGELDGTGWSEDWNIADWNIPAGLFSVTDKSTMEIMTTIARACGGLVQSHPSAKSLHFKYRYETSPKDWATSPVAATLSDALLFRQAERFSPQPKYDAVVVSGQDQGVLVQVKRDGEPGVTLAPQEVDLLILTVGVAREKGRNILDQLGYDKSELSREMPLAASPGEPGLRLPGDLVAIDEPAASWRGMVTSTTVSAAMDPSGALSVTQSLSIERAWT